MGNTGKKVLCSVGLKLSREHHVSFSLSVTLAHVHGSFSSCSVRPPEILGFLTTMTKPRSLPVALGTLVDGF